MADNIKIIGNILSTNTVSRYDEKDINLIESRQFQNYFGGKDDYIEYYIYDIGGNLLNTDYNYLNYKLQPSLGLKPSVDVTPNTTGNIQPNNTVTSYSPTSGSTIPVIEIDPIMDIQNIGYSSGEFAPKYYFFQNKLSNPIDRALFIKEISADRTEVRLASTTLTNDEIEKVANNMIDEINNSSYYVDYLLNFGDDKQYIVVNVFLNKTLDGNEILFKLYQPLPLDIQEKDTLWVVSEKVNPYSFNINLDKLIIPPPPPTLRGPNFDISIQDSNISTPYINYQDAVSKLQSLKNSSYHQLLNLMNTQSIQINVDYKVSESIDFGNFVFFGSAKTRLDNFYIKVKQIEDYTTLINKYTPLAATTSSLQSEINLYSSSINTLISQFDGYESYLYFESSSYSWPKSGSLKPFSLLSTSSVSASNWYSTQSLLAQEYDDTNYNKLTFSVPTFIENNEDNKPYLTFLNMVGHYFDNIWIYLKAITDINLTNNNLNYGISKDLVYEQLKSLGIKIYNSQAGDALDSFLIGANTGSVAWNNDFSPTSSYLNNIPRKDLVSELYKRIYHNLPLLLKQKGTVAGLNSLMTVFGIPNKTYYTVGSESFYTPTGSNSTASIINVKEYGGSLKSNLIKGYNDDKVRIVSNSILTGSNLSPILSLQTYPTASSQFRDNDMHYVDISFSPQTQMNTYISKSIASNTTTWSLDDFIGDPRYLYSSSYGLLDTERKKYYQTGVSGYAPFTASALDYNGFVRLVEYFDNALFKMLGDFVPERTSLSTGVTFESPVLERNKTPYALPSAYTGSVYEGGIDSVDMSSDYGNFYNYLTGSKKAWYDGDITGSYIDVYDYFENSNPNPYLLATSESFTTQSIYEFQHTDFNVLLNNVSKSVESKVRKRIEYIYGTTGSITSSVELQDSYLTLQSHNKSRYNGTRTYSLKYNEYTSASIQPYGKPILLPLKFITSSYDWDTRSEFPPISFPFTYGTYSTLMLNGPGVNSGIISLLQRLPISNEDPDNGYSSGLYISISSNDIDLKSNKNKIYKVNRILGTKYPDYSGWPDDPPNGIALAISDNIALGGLPTVVDNINADLGVIVQIQPYLYYNGDYSYGKTTSIDRQSYKLGWVRTVPSQSLNFYEKTTFDLKYIIDPNLQITELSSNNNNLFEIQNTFKSGTPVQVSVTNVNKPSNQVKLDGPKNIFRGGFRYDPIIFRENNETLNFIFDEPISQSINYLGFKSKEEKWYRYFATSNTHIYAPPSDFPNAYSFTSNDSEALGTPMSFAKFTPSEYRYNSSPNNKINFINPETFIRDLLFSRRVYEFNLLKFSNIVFNTDGYNDTSNNEYIYRINRTSNKYTLKGQIPFYFYGNDSEAYSFAGFKIVGIIEKTNDLNSSWEYVASTTIDPIYEQGTYIYNNPDYNIVAFDQDFAKGLYQCVLNESNISLDAGDYIRFRFFILDFSDLFGNSTNYGAEAFEFILGGDGSINNSLNERKAFFEITDLNTEYTQYYYTSSYSNITPLFVTSSFNSIETINNEAYSFFATSSTFFPVSNTQNNYTQITDRFGVQPGDLFRFGPFKQKKPPYYTVVSVDNNPRTPYLIDTARFLQLGVVGWMLYSTTEYQYAKFYPGDIINITGTANNNLTNAEIKSVQISGSFVSLFFDSTTSSNIVTENPVGTTITASFVNPIIKITFDKELTNFNPTTFAILRPKPDETSVIVDHIKSPGDVSQTLLIPSDANQTLKDKTGDIFEYYNPRLNPSTQNQQS
jgi:hypothetical protein